MGSSPKYLDYDEDIFLFSQGDMALESGVGLTNKTKVLSLAGHCSPPICFIGESIEGEEDFVCLGSIVSRRWH